MKMFITKFNEFQWNLYNFLNYILNHYSRQIDLFNLYFMKEMRQRKDKFH